MNLGCDMFSLPHRAFKESYVPKNNSWINLGYISHMILTYANTQSPTATQNFFNRWFKNKERKKQHPKPGLVGYCFSRAISLMVIGFGI